MTVHAMTLPGLGLVAPGCLGSNCPAFPEAKQGDDHRVWKTLLTAERVKDLHSYLQRHARPSDHGPRCEFRELPPSVHRRLKTRAELERAVDAQRKALALGGL